MVRTVAEMHADLDFLIDKVRTPRFTAAQRDLVLNMAQDRLIQDRYNNIKTVKGYSFEIFQRVRDELRPIVKSELLTVISGKKFSFPDDYRHNLLVRVIINGKQRSAPPTTFDELGDIEDDPFGQPTNKEPLTTEDFEGIEILDSGGTLTEVKLYYLRNPAVIKLGVQDCELPGILHTEIEQIAAAIVNTSVEDYNKRAILLDEANKS